MVKRTLNCCSVNTARYLKYVKLFFNIVLERLICSALIEILNGISGLGGSVIYLVVPECLVFIIRKIKKTL